MEFTICSTDMMEEGALPDSVSLDFDIGQENDVEISCSRGQLKEGQWIVAFGTEYAAVLEEISSNTNSSTEVWNGNAPRKFLQQFIIEPQSGQAYLTVSGDANAVMEQVLSGAFGGLFSIPEEPSGILIKNYRFDRYTDALSGFTKMLLEKNARINIEIVQGAENRPFSIVLKAVPIKNMEEEIQYSQDSKVNVELQRSKRGINHLICLGKGELLDRQVVHLYAQPDGNVGSNQYYRGFRERTAVYENTSAEGNDALIEDGIKRLKELMDFQQMIMSARDIDLSIGDIVSGRNYENGMYMAKPVVRKIVTISGGFMDIEYKVEGEE